ncbi:MAG: SGNH/GDSL hydrolase family protein [Silicimonas sp.]|nr:SGNH/GDSL hydrolase family protein [Silicimonas sp.]
MRYLITALAISLAAPASADTLGPYTDLLVFGDSLSDPGNIDQLTQGTTPYPEYYPNGQFTNGDTWAVQLGSGLGENFAFGGARAVDNGDAVPDLFAQIDIFDAVAASLGDNPLTAIWTGGNDMRDITFGFATQTISFEDAFARAAEVATTIAGSVAKLATTYGLDDFVVFVIPDISVVPAISGTPLEGFVSALSDFANQTLVSALEVVSLTLPDIEIQMFDSNAIVRGIIADPSIAGVTNTSGQCLIQTTDFTSYCGDENASDYLFFDDLHPTEGVHTLIADAFAAQVVPLPGGMSLALGGFALLGFAARRKRAA